MSVIGPLETAQQARELPQVRAIYDAMHASHRRGASDERCARLIEQACRAAGVVLGAYDRRIIAWLSQWEPQTCAVVAGLIQRAYRAGRDAATLDHSRAAAVPKSCLWCGTSPALHVWLGDPLCDGCHQAVAGEE
jgi:hypothetical protein